MRKLATFITVLWESTLRGAFTAAHAIAFKGTPF